MSFLLLCLWYEFLDNDFIRFLNVHFRFNSKKIPYRATCTVLILFQSCMPVDVARRDLPVHSRSWTGTCSLPEIPTVEDCSALFSVHQRTTSGALWTCAGPDCNSRICRQSLQSLCQKLCRNLSSYFTPWGDQLAPEEDAYFDEKDLRTITENYKRKGANVEFHV